MIRAIGLLWVAVMSGLALPVSASETYTVAPELWDRPRSGAIIMEQPMVKLAVGAYLARPGARLVMHCAAEQELMMQAEELRAWLIALAVEAGRVSVRSDLKNGEPLKIEVLR